MSKETLLQLVERLREAGQRYHDYTYVNTVAGVKLCPAAPGGEAEAPCMCGAKEHNFSVDAAAKALAAEIEQLPEFDCAKCARAECPHSGSCPARPGPPHGCSSFKGSPT